MVRTSTHAAEQRQPESTTRPCGKRQEEQDCSRGNPSRSSRTEARRSGTVSRRIAIVTFRGLPLVRRTHVSTLSLNLTCATTPNRRLSIARQDREQVERRSIRSTGPDGPGGGGEEEFPQAEAAHLPGSLTTNAPERAGPNRDNWPRPTEPPGQPRRPPGAPRNGRHPRRNRSHENALRTPVLDHRCARGDRDHSRRCTAKPRCLPCVNRRAHDAHSIPPGDGRERATWSGCAQSCAWQASAVRVATKTLYWISRRQNPLSGDRRFALHRIIQ